jgi:hypothetical protein
LPSKGALIWALVRATGRHRHGRRGGAILSMGR